MSKDQSHEARAASAATGDLGADAGNVERMNRTNILAKYIGGQWAGAEARYQVSRVLEAIEAQGWLIDTTLRAAERAELLAVLADDAARWPEGHPCRDCGALARQHPTAECDAWL